MSELTSALRNALIGSRNLRNEAADEIERLAAEVESLRKDRDDAENSNQLLRGECEMFRKENEALKQSTIFQTMERAKQQGIKQGMLRQQNLVKDYCNDTAKQCPEWSNCLQAVLICLGPMKEITEEDRAEADKLRRL